MDKAEKRLSAAILDGEDWVSCCNRNTGYNGRNKVMGNNHTKGQYVKSEWMKIAQEND